MKIEDILAQIKIPSSSVDEIDMNKLIPIDEYNNFPSIGCSNQNFNMAKVIINTSDSNRRIEEKCEVKFFLQKYLCSSEDDSLKLFNKDYKNILKKQIEKMKKEETTLRKCLLSLFDKQIVWVIINKDHDPAQFQTAMKDLKQTDASKFRNNIYCKIFIESVTYPQPAEPKSIHLYDRFMKNFQDEIRYFISIENFTDAISWCNKMTNCFFNMNKELKKQLTPEIRQKLLPEMKSIILNKTLAWMKKQNKETKKDYEEVVNIINNEYYPNFSEKDEKYLKITLRLAKCYLELRDLEKCENVLKDLLLCSPEDENVLQLKREFDQIKNIKNINAKKKLFDYFGNLSSKDEFQKDEDAIEWTTAVEDIQTEINIRRLEESVLHSLSI